MNQKLRAAMSWLHLKILSIKLPQWHDEEQPLEISIVQEPWEDWQETPRILWIKQHNFQLYDQKPGSAWTSVNLKVPHPTPCPSPTIRSLRLSTMDLGSWIVHSKKNVDQTLNHKQISCFIFSLYLFVFKILFAWGQPNQDPFCLADRSFLPLNKHILTLISAKIYLILENTKSYWTSIWLLWVSFPYIIGGSSTKIIGWK